MNHETKHTPLMERIATYGEMITEIIVGIVMWAAMLSVPYLIIKAL